MAYSGAQITRLGLSATPRGLYGSFAGKLPADIVPVPGLEWTGPVDRLHFDAPAERMHFDVTADGD